MFCPTCRTDYPDDWKACPKDATALLRSAKIGKYAIEGILGVGGMGAVYRAKNPDTGAAVAVKVMTTEASASADLKERFKREAGVVSRLDTAHVCKVFDFGSDADGTLFLVMELMKGHTLREEIAPAPRYMDLARVQMVMNGALKGLAAAHREGIVHRDLKPENVFVHDTFDGEVPKLLDFGIARVASTTEANLTRTGTMMGTASYMAPEQITGATSQMGAWTDTYAMGAILYELLAGAPAFGGSTLTEVLHRVLQGDVVALRAVRSGLPDAVYALVDSCLSIERANRPQDAEAMRRALLASGLVDARADVPPPHRTREDPAIIAETQGVEAHRKRPAAAAPASAPPPASAQTSGATRAPAPTVARRSVLPFLAIGGGIAIAGIAFAVTRNGGTGVTPRDAGVTAQRTEAAPAIDASLRVEAHTIADAALPAAVVTDAVRVVDAGVAPADAKAPTKHVAHAPTPVTPELGPGPFFCAELEGYRDPWVCWETAGGCLNGTASNKTHHACTDQASAYCGDSFVGHSCFPTEALCRRYLIPPTDKKDPVPCHLVTSWP